MKRYATYLQYNCDGRTKEVDKDAEVYFLVMLKYPQLRDSESVTTKNTPIKSTVPHINYLYQHTLDWNNIHSLAVISKFQLHSSWQLWWQYTIKSID
jgi:hypothetical protein